MEKMDQSGILAEYEAILGTQAKIESETVYPWQKPAGGAGSTVEEPGVGFTEMSETGSVMTGDPEAPFTENLAVVAKEVAGKPFRLQNQYITLTYGRAGKDVWIDKKAYLEWFGTIGETMKLAMPKPRFIRLAHEHYKDGRKHTHVLIDWGQNYQIYNPRLFDIGFDGEPIHPWIGGLKGRAHFTNFRKYLGKEDKENADLLSDVTEAKAMIAAVKKVVDEGGDLVEALSEGATKIAHIQGCKVVFEAMSGKGKVLGRDWKPPELTPRGWWVAAREWVENPNPRLVHWVYDTKGGLGKTSWLNWMMGQVEWRSRWALMNPVKEGDLLGTLESVATAFDWPGGGVMFHDFPRTYDDRASIYTIFERITNGFIVSGKYAGGCARWNPVMNVVFANFLPDWFAMSEDRWRIYDVSQEYNIRQMGAVEAKAKCIAAERARRPKGGAGGAGTMCGPVNIITGPHEAPAAHEGNGPPAKQPWALPGLAEILAERSGDM